MAERVRSIGGRLTHSLDFDSTLGHVVRLPIPSLADWCVVYTPGDGDARLPRLVVAHADPGKEALLRAAWSAGPLALSREHPLLVSLHSRKPLVQARWSTDELAAVHAGGRHADLLRLVGLDSLLVLPLVAHGLVVGALMLVLAGDTPRTFDAIATASAAAVANCCAQAIYNAQLFWEARLAVRTREELVSAASRDLLRLTSHLKKRVTQLRARAGALPIASPAALHNGLSEIEDLAGGVLRCIQDLAPMEVPTGRHDSVDQSG